MKKHTLIIAIMLITFFVACKNESKNDNNSNNKNDNTENTSENNTNEDIKNTNADKGIDFVLDSSPLSQADGIDDDGEIFELENTNFKLMVFDGTLYFLDQEHNMYSLSDDLFKANDFNTSYKGEAKNIGGKNLLFITWQYGDARSGFEDGYEEDYSGLFVINTDDLICLTDIVYKSFYMYYEGDGNGDEHAKMSENTQFEEAEYSYDFSTTSNGFKLTNYTASLSNDFSTTTYSNLTNYQEGNYELKNGKFVCDKKLPFKGATNGMFFYASCKKLTDGELKNASKGQLKIMRNEIFARHGFTFKTDKMKKYFEDCEWFKATKNDVNSELSDIENANIKLISSYEKK